MDILYPLVIYPQNQIANNTTSSTPFVTADEVVYFRGTDDKLWRVDSGGTSQFQIGTNTTKSTPFVINDGSGDLVFFQGTDDRLLMVRGDSAGSGLTQIGGNKTKSAPFVTFDSSTGVILVFFQGTDDRLLMVHSDGTGGSQIGGNKTKSTPCVTADGWVFFQGTDDKLWRVRIDGTEQLQIGKDEDGKVIPAASPNTTASTPAVGRRQRIGYQMGRWVYFRGTDDKLWRYFQPDQLDKDQVERLQPPPKKQGERILEIQYTNPEHLTDFGVQDAQTVAFGHPEPSTTTLSSILGRGPFPSVDAEQEWKQALPTDLTDTKAHNADYEGPNLVGATGWVLHPECSQGDVPLDHPFGFDWEFMLALDQPDADKNRYTFLLTPGDQTCAEEGTPEALQAARAIGLIDQIPRGPAPDNLPSLLGVEMDGGLVPQQFIENVAEGDRMAVFGRWIVDCGHQLPIVSCEDPTRPSPSGPAFRTEIHPPLLMAAAKVTTGSILRGGSGTGEVTRVLFTSRPYLVSQRYTVDTDTIWDDSGAESSGPDDGPLVSHLVKELIKVNQTILGIPLASVQIEAHPRIKSKPFLGTYSLHFVVRPPLLKLVKHGSEIVIPPARLVVSYQFTVRNGCNVQVTANGVDSVNVVITLDSGSYKAPRHLNRRERAWHPDELANLNSRIAATFSDAERGSALVQWLGPGTIIGSLEVWHVIEKGIKTDEYDVDEVRNVNILDASHAVTAFGDQIPADQGVVTNDTQPYPVVGWLEVSAVSIRTVDLEHVQPTT